MAVPNWGAYVGLVGGIVGTVTGIIGAVTGGLAYRRTGQFKVQDLRLELRRADQDLRHLVHGLTDQLTQADGSRRAVLAMQGAIRSGAMDRWAADLAVDMAKVEQMQAGLPESNADYGSLSGALLEQLLVERHDSKIAALAIRDKYLTALGDDDKSRDRHQALRREIFDKKG